MTSTKVVDLAQWKAEHPPLVRLLTIGAHCWQAYFRLIVAAQSAVISSAARWIR
jgi:hypothetical protein